MSRTHYANVTINDKNIFKRNLQKTRYRHALLALKELSPSFSGNILDYGCGNGQLCKYISESFPVADLTMYEPASELREEAAGNLKDYLQIRITDSISNISASFFDVIFCLAVFEHILEDRYCVMLNDFNKLLKSDGLLVIGVPVEVHLPALFKGVFRMGRRYGAYDANIKNVFRCVIGKPPGNRPISNIDVSLPYYFDHLGFNERIFRNELIKHFKIYRIYGSPLPFLWVGLNFEKYYLCKKYEKIV